MNPDPLRPSDTDDSYLVSLEDDIGRPGMVLVFGWLAIAFAALAIGYIVVSR